MSDTSYAARLPAGVAKAHPVINNDGGSEEIWYIIYIKNGVFLHIL